MSSPTDRRYLESHEWHKLDGDVVTIGISKFAVDELTDITYIELARTEGQIEAGESFGEVESVKATSDLYSGVSGEIIEVNQDAVDNPAVLNDDPYEAGWLLKVRVPDTAEYDGLLSAADYDEKAGI